MIDPKLLDNLAHKLAEAVPGSVRELQHDVEKNFRAVLQSAFVKLDLVSREEFEVQVAVLARTREKLEELEKIVAKLESEGYKRTN